MISKHDLPATKEIPRLSTHGPLSRRQGQQGIPPYVTQAVTEYNRCSQFYRLLIPPFLADLHATLIGESVNARAIGSGQRAAETPTYSASWRQVFWPSQISQLAHVHRTTIDDASPIRLTPRPAFQTVRSTNLG